MNVLVTGGTGFIAQALIRELYRKGARVSATVRNSATTPLEYALPLFISDIGSQTDWCGKLSGYDTVIHTAARVHVMKETVDDPLRVFRMVNTDGTLTLARTCASSGIRRFIYLSSIKVNGENTPIDRPFTPDDRPSPVGPYGISKYEAEEGLRSISNETGMEVVIIRPPLVYGPGVKGNFRKIMEWLHRGIPLPLGNINNLRSLVSLPNIIDFIILCAERTETINETFLVSDGRDISTTELLNQLGNAMGKKHCIFPLPRIMVELLETVLGKQPSIDRLFGSLRVDITKSQALLGWVPPFSLENGLAQTAQAFLKEKARKMS